MADDKSLFNAISFGVIVGLDPASNCFENFFDEDNIVIPRRAEREPGDDETNKHGDRRS